MFWRDLDGVRTGRRENTRTRTDGRFPRTHRVIFWSVVWDAIPQAEGAAAMRADRTHQPLTYDVRLPDEAQADALRLLHASRGVVNEALTTLWPYLDAFGTDRVGPAWKQVGKYIASPSPYGDRQWLCEKSTVGRILRAQAERKRAFLLVLPILSDGFIRPTTEKRPAGKNRPAIKEAITTVQKSLGEDETSFVALQNVVEQACNFFFQHDR